MQPPFVNEMFSIGGNRIDVLRKEKRSKVKEAN